MPFKFPSIIHTSTDKFKGTEVSTNHLMTCFDFGNEEDLLLKGFIWPQALYINPFLGKWLRETFSYHAAYFVGNYLFGTSTSPSDECKVPPKEETIEGWSFPIKRSMYLKVEEYPSYINKCDLNDKAHLITNVDVSPDNFKSIFKFDPYNQVQTLCGIHKLMSSFRIHQTFGSRLGFWANALQGKNGSFFNTIDKVCVKTLHSQTGSVWHTFCKGYETPLIPNPDIFPINDYFYICGPNSFDARLYLEYLLW